MIKFDREGFFTTSDKFHANLGKNIGNGNNPVVLILDDNFYYRSMRKQYYQLSKICMFFYFTLDFQVRIPFMSISFRTPMDECIRRNAERCNSVPDSVINRMESRFEWPDSNICPWERYNLELNNSITINRDIEDFVGFVLDQPLVFVDLEQLEAERENSREINNANAIHILDDVLRSLVKRYMNSLGKVYVN